MLNEDTYIPHDVTYDVTGWSNPLLMNVAGGYSGSSTLTPVADHVDPLNEPAWTHEPADDLRIALFEAPGRRRSSPEAPSGGSSRRSGAWMWTSPTTRGPT